MSAIEQADRDLADDLHVEAVYEETDDVSRIVWSAEGKPLAMIAVLPRAGITVAIQRSGGSASAPGAPRADAIIKLPVPPPTERRMIKRIEVTIVYRGEG